MNILIDFEQALDSRNINIEYQPLQTILSPVRIVICQRQLLLISILAADIVPANV